MVRCSEAVLPGHPDKVCDAVAEAIVQAALKVDPQAYAQIEVSAWDYDMWLTGGIMARTPLDEPLEQIALRTVMDIGYRPPNACDGSRIQVRNSVCFDLDDPRKYTNYVNDQCIVIGWAGYDSKVDFLPPEHWLARQFASRLAQSCRSGILKDHGPDGKLIVRMREEGKSWILEHLLVTLQQLEETPFAEIVSGILAELGSAYQAIQSSDSRWERPWEEVEKTINPNGPFLLGGPLSDNGQTGRKLVMDYYGPRVPLGGGALYGKDPTHIDRFGARKAREAAVHAVKTGATECLVRVAYAPNISESLDVCYEMVGRGGRKNQGFFVHGSSGDSRVTKLTDNPDLLEATVRHIHSESAGICPVPRQWDGLYKILLKQFRLLELGLTPVEKPPIPLILGGWHMCSDSEKSGQLLCQVQWAARHGCLPVAAEFLLSLKSEDWHHG